jgi:two-component system response regulator YesN
MNTARHVNLSQSYFSTVFKKELGISFSDYVIQMRIDKAKEMFIANDCKISYVANALGFNDPSYFSRVFKKVTGQTPSEFRMGSPM